MNDIILFRNPEFGDIRTVTINDEPWLVGKDVAEALGYANPKNAVPDHVDGEDKLSTQIEYAGQKRTVTLINESGLYSLVLSSKLPGARKFRHWVTAEVLPSIRKHGAYATPDTLERMIADPDTTIRLLQELKGEQDKRKALETKVEEDRPKTVFADAVSVSNTSILIGELAKLLKQNGVDIGQNRLFVWMRERGYLINRVGASYNLPTQRAMELGLFEIKESTVCHSDGHTSINRTPKVTGKGQIYFINKFLEKANNN